MFLNAVLEKQHVTECCATIVLLDQAPEQSRRGFRRSVSIKEGEKRAACSSVPDVGPLADLNQSQEDEEVGSEQYRYGLNRTGRV